MIYGPAEQRPKRKAAESATEVLKNMLEDDAQKEMKRDKKSKTPKREVPFVNDLFKCAYASEDSQLIEDDERDVRNLFVDVHWLKVSEIAKRTCRKADRACRRTLEPSKPERSRMPWPSTSTAVSSAASGDCPTLADRTYLQVFSRFGTRKISDPT